jgi:hypothetical protein
VNKSSLSPLLITVFLFACKKKSKGPEKHFISIPSLIHEQVAHIDTSLYMIVKYVTDDSFHTDTSYIKREDFGKEAAEFTNLPDLSDKNVARDYKEEPPIFDETLNRVILDYTPLDAGNRVKKLELIIDPSAPESENIRSIIATIVESNRNEYLKKEMLWQMDKSFQVVTTSQYPGQPEKNITVKLSWNEDSDQ